MGPHNRERLIVGALVMVAAACILGLEAFTGVPETALAANVTLTAMPCDVVCGGVKVASIVFADGVECTASTNVGFASADAAAAGWAAHNPPFPMTRVRPRWASVAAGGCAVGTTDLSGPWQGTMTALTLTTGVVAGLAVVNLLMNELRWAQVRRWARGNQVHPVAAPVPPPPPKQQQPTEDVRPTPLLPHAARLVAAAALARGDVCTVSLEPLDHVALMVPPCGHVVNEAVAASLHACPQCRLSPLVFTRVSEASCV